MPRKPPVILKTRVATPDDVHDVMDLAIASTKEASLSQVNPEKILNEIWPALHRNGGIVCVVTDVSGNIDGVVFLKFITLWYSDDILLEEQFMYVKPSLRAASGGRGKRLSDFSKKVADEMGMSLVTVLPSSNESEGMSRLYSRLYGKQAGTWFFYNKSAASNQAEISPAA